MVLKRGQTVSTSIVRLGGSSMAVFHTFKDIKCATSGKALFGNKNITIVHKSMLKHMKQNSISDILLVLYYILIEQGQYYHYSLFY